MPANSLCFAYSLCLLLSHLLCRGIGSTNESRIRTETPLEDHWHETTIDESLRFYGILVNGKRRQLFILTVATYDL